MQAISSLSTIQVIGARLIPQRLGISKGNTQSTDYASGRFDEVAFKGIRHCILEIFQAVGMLVGERRGQFERRFHPTEKDFALRASCDVH